MDVFSLVPLSKRRPSCTRKSGGEGRGPSFHSQDLLNPRTKLIPFGQFGPNHVVTLFLEPYINQLDIIRFAPKLSIIVETLISPVVGPGPKNKKYLRKLNSEIK